MTVLTDTSAPDERMDPFPMPSSPQAIVSGALDFGGRPAMSSLLSDETLLAGLASGDADLAVAFIRRFQDRVDGLARRLVGETPLAQDVAQEAFLRAWRHAPRFESRQGSVTTWLLAITRNLAIDALRRRQGEPLPLDLLVSLEPDTRAKGPAELAADADDASRLRQALGRLPTQQRRAVVLAFLYGQTAQEVSIIERIPLGTAKTRIKLGMSKLRSAMPPEPAACGH